MSNMIASMYTWLPSWYSKANYTFYRFACDCQGMKPPRTGDVCDKPVFAARWTNVLPSRAVLGAPYSYTPRVSTTYTGNVLYIAEGLPCGYALNNVTGELSGVAGFSGVFHITVYARNEEGQTIVVNNDPFKLVIVDCDDAFSCNGGRCMEDDGDRYNSQFGCNCSGTQKKGTRCDIDKFLPNEIVTGEGEIRQCQSFTTPNRSTIPPTECVFETANTTTNCQVQIVDTLKVGSELTYTCGDVQTPWLHAYLLPNLNRVSQLKFTRAEVLQSFLAIVRQSTGDGVGGARRSQADNNGAEVLQLLDLRSSNMTSIDQVLELVNLLQIPPSQLNIDCRNNPFTLPPLDLSLHTINSLLLSPAMISSTQRKFQGQSLVNDTTVPATCMEGGAASSLKNIVVCEDNHTTCSANDRCPAGSFTLVATSGQVVCEACSAGGFYQDEQGAIGSASHCGCKSCGLGTYVAPPGGASTAANCVKCPLNTDPTSTSGYRACPCLAGYYRKGRFDECYFCERDLGVTCNHDIRSLEPGYWYV
eukprot:m.344442 g.344442  ORF g.344442 m.344442 type:complete len:531 (-) comp24477_c0_seq1:39-1631(-)